jgi:hypothetical protein
MCSEHESVASVETALRSMLTMTNEWLRFAETKNGALVAFSGVAVGAYAKGVIDADHYPLIQWFLALAVLMTLGAVAVSLTSFVPTLVQPRPPRAGGSSVNVLFFGDAAGFRTGTEYVTAVRTAYGFPADNVPPMEVALAEQIVTNARIATLKFQYFRIAIYLFAAGLFTIAGAGLIYLLEQRHRPKAA